MNNLKTSATLSAVVPLIEPHVRFFSTLLQNIELQTKRFDEIILVASGLSEGSLELVSRDLLSSTYSKAFRILSNSIFPSGKNRNIGAKATTSELVLFLDADDTYHPLRNAAVLEVFARTNFDALMTRSFPLPESVPFDWNSNFNVENWAASYLIEPSEVFDRTFASGRKRHKEMLGAPSVVSAPPETGNLSVLHHGHMAVRRSVFTELNQHEQSFPRNEDSVFARDILWSGRRLYILNVPLSHYRTDSSSNNPKNGSLLNILSAVPTAFLCSPVSHKGMRPS